MSSISVEAAYDMAKAALGEAIIINKFQEQELNNTYARIKELEDAKNGTANDELQ